MNRTQIVAQLQIDEGFAPQSFWDNDQWTYGYGTKAAGPGKFISKEEALKVLIARTDLAIDDFYDIYAGCVMSEVREQALVNMAFNLGETKLRRFPGMNAAIRTRDWGTVAFEAFNSAWFKQLSKAGLKTIERAERIVWELLTGEKG